MANLSSTISALQTCRGTNGFAGKGREMKDRRSWRDIGLTNQQRCSQGSASQSNKLSLSLTRGLHNLDDTSSAATGSPVDFAEYLMKAHQLHGTQVD